MNILKTAFAILAIVSVLAFLIPFALLAELFKFVHKSCIGYAWWQKHGQHGKSFLVIYSSSPKWEDYFLNRVTPLFKENAVIINISTNHQYNKESIERKAHKLWGKGRNHTPIILYFKKFYHVKTIRLYDAFMSMEKNKSDAELVTKINELELLLKTTNR